MNKRKNDAPQTSTEQENPPSASGTPDTSDTTELNPSVSKTI